MHALLTRAFIGEGGQDYGDNLFRFAYSALLCFTLLYSALLCFTLLYSAIGEGGQDYGDNLFRFALFAWAALEAPLVVPCGGFVAYSRVKQSKAE
jgi:hypothetical protein